MASFHTGTSHQLVIALLFFLFLACNLAAIPPQDQPLSESSASAVDFSFDFVNSKEEWGQATISESQCEVYHRNEELRLQITGIAALVSPRLLVQLQERQTLVIRYRSIGSGTKGKFTLRVASSSMMPDTTDHGYKFISWDDESNRDTFIDAPFDVISNGQWHTAYTEIPFSADDNVSDHHLTQLRLWPVLPANNGTSFHIDWIRLVRAPVIKRVSGCQGGRHSDSSSFETEEYTISQDMAKANEALYAHKTIWQHRNTELEYSRTYNCVRTGGETIFIEGSNFGAGGWNDFGAPAHVFIGGEPCTNVTHDPDRPQQMVSCVSPATSSELDSYDGPLVSYPSVVQVRNGQYPDLIDEQQYFTYAKAPAKPVNLTVSNIASRSIDVSWAPGGSVWNHMTVTGYVLRWMTEHSSDLRQMVVGNVTKTTIRDLKPNARYFIGVSALAEDQRSIAWWAGLDPYGRRPILDNALEGLNKTMTAHTLATDIYFDHFDANLTQSHGPIDERSSVGPTGIELGEGHYGLNLVGDAGIENCNSSSFCCDDYDPRVGGCSSDAWTCRATAYRESHQSRYIIEPIDKSIINTIDSRCGPALRLTGPNARLRGAARYPRAQEVAEGFVSTFTFRISNPSVRCNAMDEVYSRCSSRGADGLAFVIQGESPNVLGEGGNAMGYGGINNSLAVEFDSYFNYEELDPYANHISVQTRGWRYPNESNHTYSLGHTNAVPDMTGGEISIKVEYIPRFDIAALSKTSFVASPYSANFFQNANYPDGGLGDWGANGLGMLSIYCMDLNEPVLVVPLNLATTLNLDGGRAFVGFTAATGEETWQAHEILDWTFSSHRMDTDYFPPVVVNGIGAYA